METPKNTELVAPFQAFLAAMQNPNEPFASQAFRTLSYVSTGAAELGEVLALLGRGKLAQPLSFDEKRVVWFDSWSTLAARILQQGEASEASGHPISAASSYLRATEYYRQSAFYLREDLDDDRLKRAMLAARDAFLKHARCADIEPQSLHIPYESSYLHAIYVPARHHQEATGAPPSGATVLVFPGYDSCAEEAWYGGGQALWKRGHSVLLIEGPGQNLSLVLNKLPMRADYEIVLDKIGDWLQHGALKDKVDISRLALFSRSFGGYLGLRMAAGSWVKLVAVALDPLQAGFQGMERRFLSSAEVALLHGGGAEGLRALDEILTSKFELSPSFRFMFLLKTTMCGNPKLDPWIHFLKNRLCAVYVCVQRNVLHSPSQLHSSTYSTAICLQIMSRAAAHGISSPAGYIAQISGPNPQYHAYHLLHQIQCPLWTSVSAAENLSAQADEKVKAAVSKLTVQEFSLDDGAIAHCESGGLQRLLQCMTDWMDEKLKQESSS